MAQQGTYNTQKENKRNLSPNITSLQLHHFYNFLFLSKSARAKKLINAATTPQQASPEHRSVSRRTAGVSQSQRKQ